MKHRAEGRTHEALLAAGLPTWAPYGPSDQEESVYVWVADDDGPQLLLIGDEDVGRQVASFCVEILSGREPRPAGEPATDLSTPVALAHARADSFGHGPLGRKHVRPLRQLLEFIVDEVGHS